MSRPDRYMHVGPKDSVDPNIKQREADELRGLIEEFKARGGVIEKLGTTPRRIDNEFAPKKRGGRKKATIMQKQFGKGTALPEDKISLESAIEDEFDSEEREEIA